MLYLLLALFTAAIVAVDQLTKYLAASNLVGKTVTLIPGWLQLHYITNDGMALSLLRGARWLFVVMTAVYLAVVIYVLVKKWFKKTPELWCIAAITGGAIGNFIDRISTGLVIDMICIPWFSTFNVADLFITFGALILVVYILTKDKELLADKPKEQKKPHDADACQRRRTARQRAQPPRAGTYPQSGPAPDRAGRGHAGRKTRQKERKAACRDDAGVGNSRSA